VPLDPKISERHFTDILERVDPRVIVAETRIGADTVKCISFEELAAECSANNSVDSFEIDAGQPADILFTTGTTGRSKGVVLSHRALTTACAHINAFIGTQAEAVEVLPLPLSHSFGLGRVRCILSIGATLVLLPGFVNTAILLNALSEHHATGFASVPTGIAILLSDSGIGLEQFAQQLEYIEIGSAPMPQDQKQHLMRLLPDTRICMHYGLTEASRSAYLNFHDDRDRLDSIGKPSPGVSMRVVDESGHEAVNGTDGQIQISGGHLMSEYWQDADLTAKTLNDGWLTTGDRGRRDPDGYFYLLARTSDIINVGGRKVSPHELEEILASHPAITECVCVGLPDPQGISGEIISAFLVADSDAEDLPKFSELAKLLRQHVEPHKIPRRFKWIDEIPKSSSGKVLRRRLKDAK
jgi:long-chain acyl-CoA synthetase